MSGYGREVRIWKKVNARIEDVRLQKRARCALMRALTGVHCSPFPGLKLIYLCSSDSLLNEVSLDWWVMISRRTRAKKCRSARVFIKQSSEDLE